uniref:PBPb domain-containing protein n=1 Tax=Panagrellus redivivus TaxID=6233 RepID=A0A7E4VNR5_PANRE
MIAASIDMKIDTIAGDIKDYGGGVGNLVNGTWKGLLGAVYNGSVDLVALLFQYTDDRAAYFDQSYPVYNVDLVYIVRKKQRTIGAYLWNCLEPYSTYTWIFLLLSLLVQIIWVTIVRRTEYAMGLIDQFEVFDKVWQFSRLQIHQGGTRAPFESYAGVIAFTFFALLQASFFYNLYEASLLAALMQPADTSPFQTAPEMVALIKSGRYKLLATEDNYKSSWYFTDLAHSNDEHFKTLREAIAKNPVVLTDTIASALDMLENGDYIYPAQQDAQSLILMRQKCNLITFSNGLPSVSAYYLFQQNSSLISSFNSAIVHNQAFIRRTVKKYFEENFLLGPVARCPETIDDVPESQRPLDIIAVFGIFVILICGITLASLVLLLELWFIRFARRHFHRDSSAFGRRFKASTQAASDLLIVSGFETMKCAILILLVGAAMAVKYGVTTPRPTGSTTTRDPERWVREADPLTQLTTPSPVGSLPAARPRREASPFGWVIPPPPPIPQFNPNIPLAWQIPPQPQLSQPIRPWGSNNNVEDNGIQNRWEGTNSWLNDLNLRNSESIFTPIKTSNGQIVWVPPTGPVQHAPWPQAIFRSPLHGVYYD